MPDIPSAQVLRNRGCPIYLYKLDEDGRVPPSEQDKDVPRDKAWVRFTAAVCSEIEQRWDGATFLEDMPTYTPGVLDAKGEPLATGLVQVERKLQGLNAWQKALEIRPTTTLIATLAIVLGQDEDTVAARLIPSETGEYQGAVGAAFAMANGLDPEAAGKLLAAGWKAARIQKDEMAREALARLSEMDVELEKLLDSSRGTNGSASGSEIPTPGDLVETTKSSGP